MAPDTDDDQSPEAELAEQHEQKEAEVLHREGVEQELMQKDESDQGEEIDDVE